MKKNYFVLCCFLFLETLSAQVTWSVDIAPIIYENCSGCHHDGGIGTIPLMSYEDVYNNAWDIHHFIEDREMPPWPADPNYRHFANETYLVDWQIDAIHQWIENDMPMGEESLEPEPPVFEIQGSLLEQIDVVLEIEPYEIQTDVDEYRWFAIENPYDETFYISKIEVIPGLNELVHHADLFLDNTGNSLALDAADPLSGFNSATGGPTNTYYINAWQPGAEVAGYPPNWGIKVEPGDNFVIEIHYGPGGLGLEDQTRMNLQLLVPEPDEDVRAVRAGWLLWDSWPVLIDGPLVIPANEVVSFHQVSSPLPEALSLISICPHMHFLGKSYKVWAETPEGETIPLIDIPNWDFHWQKYYTFQQIQHLPAGTVMKSEGYYDNTENNHDNPNTPPIDVFRGQFTTDEMFLTFFIYSNYEEGDEDIVLDSTILYTNIHEENANLEWEIQPNPAYDFININVPNFDKNATVRILDQYGKIIKTVNLHNENELINIRDILAGIYFVEFEFKGQTKVKKFIKI